MIYLYYLECKDGCKFEHIVETDAKDHIKKTKPVCPICGKRIFENPERTTTSEHLKVKAAKIPKKEQLKHEIKRRQTHKILTDKRRKKTIEDDDNED